MQQARSIVDQSSTKLAEETKARVAASASLRAEQAAAAADGDRLKAQVEQLKRCVCVCGCRCDPLFLLLDAAMDRWPLPHCEFPGLLRGAATESGTLLPPT